AVLFDVLRSLFPRQYPGENETVVHLAVHPRCGPLSGRVSDVNAGLDSARYKTIVAFGDSYTDGGRHDGEHLAPAVMIPPDPFAGGRSTNGKVWVEYLADEVGADLMDYAGLPYVFMRYPTHVCKASMFLDQAHRLDPATTLYTIFFGINDWEDSFFDGDNLPQAAEDLLNQIDLLSQPPTNALNFLVTDVYGRGRHNEWGEAWLQSIFDGLIELHTRPTRPLNVAFANFAAIWDGVLGSDPGYEAFGYVSTDACNPDSTTETSCSDPDHYFYWFVGHPSRVTHRIMAEYVREVLGWCRVQ
ncbi:hypothetical protein ID866_7287, partial [Astraeus odoratus]